MAGVREDELFDFNRGLFSVELTQENAGDFVGEAFDEFEGLRGAELGDAFGDVVVVDSVVDIVGLRSAGEVAGHFDGDEQALRLGTLFIGYADFAEDTEVFDGDRIHDESMGRHDNWDGWRSTV